MTAEIMKELTTMKDTSKVISEQVLSWAQRTEVLRSQKAVILIKAQSRMLTNAPKHNIQYWDKHTKMQILWDITPPTTVSNIWEDLCNSTKVNHFISVCRCVKKLGKQTTLKGRRGDLQDKMRQPLDNYI